MIEVVIDTNIFRQDPKKDKLAFRTLHKLTKLNLVRVHLPEIIEKEFTTQETLSIDSSIQNLKRSLNTLRKKAPYSLQDRTDELISSISDLSLEIRGHVSEDFKNWIKEYNVEYHKIADNHGRIVVNSYFLGEAPFKKIKERKDFPDAFIYQSLIDLCSKRETKVYFISSDKPFIQSAKKINNCVTLDSLDKFITKTLDTLMEDKKSKEIISPFLHREILYDYIDNKDEFDNIITNKVRNKLEKQLLFSHFKTDDIPTEINYSTIEYINEVISFTLDKNNIVMAGFDSLYIGYLCTINAGVYFHIDKQIFYSFDENIIQNMSVEDAENRAGTQLRVKQDLQLEINGLFSISLNFDSVRTIEDVDFSKYIEDSKITIESIEVTNVPSLKL